MSIAKVRAELRSLAAPAVAASSAKFFKTGPGQYGEGYEFIGIRVPALRQVAKQFHALPLQDLADLLASRIHEERLLALLILVGRAERATDDERKQLYDFYVAHFDRVNNWDLVDTSAPTIVGGYLIDKSRRPLHEWARSSSLWERRIAIIATLHFIRMEDYQDTLKISRLLLRDSQDLIHKATGWMLREVGKRDLPALESFLEQHAAIMPRTMLRYAIERMTAEQRAHWM